MPKGDAEDLRADLDDGYAKVANLLLEALACAPLTGTEHAVVYFVFRRTFGWAKKRDQRSGKMDAMTAEEIAQGTARPTSSIRRALQSLVKAHVLISTPVKAGNYFAYGVNPDVFSWGLPNPEWKDAKTQLREAKERGTYKQKRADLYAELRTPIRNNAHTPTQNCAEGGAFSPAVPGPNDAPTDSNDVQTERRTDSKDSIPSTPMPENGHSSTAYDPAQQEHAILGNESELVAAVRQAKPSWGVPMINGFVTNLLQLGINDDAHPSITHESVIAALANPKLAPANRWADDWIKRFEKHVRLQPAQEEPVPPEEQEWFPDWLEEQAERGCALWEAHDHDLDATREALGNLDEMTARHLDKIMQSVEGQIAHVG